MQCLDCEEIFQAETQEDMMQEMMPHYKEVHAEMMNSGTEEKRMIWMSQFQDAWDNAEEI